MFTAEKCAEVREEITRVLQKHFGDTIKVETDPGQFDYWNFEPKLLLTLPKPDGEYETPEMANFRKYQSRHGLPLDVLHKTFWYEGNTYKIEGFLPRNQVQCIAVTDVVDGSRWKYDVETVRAALNTKQS